MILHIYYLHGKRATHINSPRNEWFSFEKCFSNFTSTMGKSNLTLMIDGTPDAKTFIDDNEYRKIYLPAPPECDYPVQVSRGYDNAWREIVKTIKCDIDSCKIKFGDLIYIAEDDYVHLPEWKACVIDLFTTHPEFKDNAYLTLYDHPDKYYFNMQPRTEFITDKYRIYVSMFRHWRQTRNGCGNFIVSRDLFLKDYEIHINFPGDGERSQELRDIGREYLSPIPSLSSHLHAMYPAPIIDWREILEQY